MISTRVFMLSTFQTCVLTCDGLVVPAMHVLSCVLTSLSLPFPIHFQVFLSREAMVDAVVVVAVEMERKERSSGFGIGIGEKVERGIGT
jgi:hypothetical protein